MVGRELDRLEEAGVIRKVNHATWAAPLVPVPKNDGTLRLCGDFKVTINPVLLVDQYPLPKPADLMACLTGSVCFSKLDLTSAYQQMLLDDECAKLVTVNTHQGLYKYIPVYLLEWLQPQQCSSVPWKRSLEASHK